MAQFPFKDFIDAWRGGNRSLRTKSEIANTEANPIPTKQTGSYVGYSTETKPAGKKGDQFVELDTKDVYFHDGENWVIF